MVTLTDKAASKVKELMNGQAEESHAGLRVAVRGGGCSGFQYALAFDEQRDGDQIFEYRRSSSWSTRRACPSWTAPRSTTSRASRAPASR